MPYCVMKVLWAHDSLHSGPNRSFRRDTIVIPSARTREMDGGRVALSMEPLWCAWSEVSRSGVGREPC